MNDGINSQAFLKRYIYKKNKKYLTRNYHFSPMEYLFKSDLSDNRRVSTHFKTGGDHLNKIRNLTLGKLRDAEKDALHMKKLKNEVKEKDVERKLIFLRKMKEVLKKSSLIRSPDSYSKIQGMKWKKDCSRSIRKNKNKHTHECRIREEFSEC